ncbi:Hypothetical predicted protein, partial [Marmota monax]
SLAPFRGRRQRAQHRGACGMAVSWRSWLANEGVKHLCLLIWLSLNVLLFWKTFLLYNQGPEYHYLHQMLG